VRQDAERGIFNNERKRQMSTEISTNTTPARGLALASFDDALRFAKTASESAFVPKEFRGKPAECMLAVQKGAEVGLQPLESLQSIAVINGRPCIWGDAAMALVQASPVCEYVTERIEGEGEAMVAICEAKRRGYPTPTVVRFSVADAKKAGLWAKQGPWAQYPSRMLSLRARGFALRNAFADALRGLITAEEAQDYPTPATTPVRVAQPEPTPDPQPVKAATDADMTKARAAIQRANDLGKLGDFLATVNERYESGFYTAQQADDLRNLIDTKIDWLNSSEEVPA
jgi:hypothetical protein